MELTDKQNKLLDFVKLQHGEQKRKYTNEPYWHHLLSVATIVAEYDERGIEIALCHDLFEDTKCGQNALHTFLSNIGYADEIVIRIVCGVIDLTDRFVKEKYPDINRARRKELEADRLGSIYSLSQSVKYADLIDNTSSIVQHDKSFAKVYLSEKKEILSKMRKGNPALLMRCEETLAEALLKLEKQTV